MESLAIRNIRWEAGFIVVTIDLGREGHMVICSVAREEFPEDNRTKMSELNKMG